MAEKGRPFTATQLSVILGELLLRKDFLSGTSEGNLLSQDRSSSGSTPKGSCTSVLTIKQTNKQTPSYYRIPCHLKSNSSSRPSLISPLKIHPGRTPGFGVGSCFKFIQENFSHISLQIYIIMLSQGLFYKADVDKNKITDLFRPPRQTYGTVISTPQLIGVRWVF